MIDLAKIGYIAYGQLVDFKNYQGNPMPTWEELPEKIRAAWKAGAAAIANAITSKEHKLLPEAEMISVISAFTDVKNKQFPQSAPMYSLTVEPGAFDQECGEDCEVCDNVICRKERRP